MHTGRGDVCKATEQQSATTPHGAKAEASGDAAEKVGRLQTDSQCSAEWAALSVRAGASGGTDMGQEQEDTHGSEEEKRHRTAAPHGYCVGTGALVSAAVCAKVKLLSQTKMSHKSCTGMKKCDKEKVGLETLYRPL